MRIGTLTFHSACNYGAMLQAYALPVAVRELGHECEVIDYRHQAFSEEADVQWPGDLIKQYGPLRGSIKAINRWRLGWYDSRRKNIKFNRFMLKKMTISRETYRTPEELSGISYDAVLFGSDQIWNENLTGGMALEYFGQCIPCKKIAYAASSGTDRIPECTIELLREFRALGIRELGLSQYLCSKGLEAKTVLDPVLLLTPQQWRKIEAPLPKGIEKGRYIFVYTFDEQGVYDLARKIGKEENLPIVNVRWCGRHDRFNDMIQLPDCSPELFLALLDSAALVCTSSFHGTAFSVLFEKRFYCCTPQGFGSRTNSLLSQLGLLSCRVENGVCSKELPDYQAATAKLAQLRTESLEFLESAIGRR